MDFKHSQIKIVASGERRNEVLHRSSSLDEKNTSQLHKKSSLSEQG